MVFLDSEAVTGEKSQKTQVKLYCENMKCRVFLVVNLVLLFLALCKN